MGVTLPIEGLSDVTSPSLWHVGLPSWHLMRLGSDKLIPKIQKFQYKYSIFSQFKYKYNALLFLYIFQDENHLIMIIGHMIIWDQAGADILLWSIVFHGLNHLVYPHGSEVRGGVYTILRSIVVYCGCFVGSTVGDYSVCSVWCVHFVFFCVQWYDVFVDVAYSCNEVCLHVFILGVVL